MKNLQIVCLQCEAINRVPENRLVAHPKCGKCGQPLFNGQPVELSQANFHRNLQKNDIPLLVDFWAPWCGPCKMMAPAFSEAATLLEPHVRLAKVDTEAEPQLGAQLNIRSIPTMVLFRNGQEVARQSGAMSSAAIIQWVNGQL